MAIPQFTAPDTVRAGTDFNADVAVRNKDFVGGPDTATLTIEAVTNGTTVATAQQSVTVGSNQTRDVTVEMTIPEAGSYTLKASLSGGISGSASTNITVKPRPDTGDGQKPPTEPPEDEIPEDLLIAGAGVVALGAVGVAVFGDELTSK